VDKNAIETENIKIRKIYRALRMPTVKVTNEDLNNIL